ncbi:MAG: arsenical pump-driving ATPase [Gammaproteobacteria bacterium]|nr:arsenical pump-driving ATPase [Gammaproteobacteria bacterium]
MSTATRFLENAPRHLFFTGKGGVGKTSLACAAALRLAEQGLRVLLVSTDPASNIGQVFGVAIGHRIMALPGVARLWALEIDPQAAAQTYRNRILDPVRESLPKTVVDRIEEQLSGACTTEIAAFDEFTSLLADSTLNRDFDHIVFDTAPTGHTIRLLQLPGAWSGFLESGPGDTSCLGPLAGLDKQRAQYKAAVNTLGDPEQTRFVLVARAQHAALMEVARTCDELVAIGLAQHHLVINGLLPAAEAGQGALAAAIYQREQAALAALPKTLQALPCDRIALKPFNLVGLGALRALLDDTVLLTDPPGDLRAPAPTETLATLVDAIAAGGHGLVLFMGKGGVGKTTLAAAVAVALARRGLPVHLTTSDPAAHLDATLQGATAHLTVSRIDPEKEAARYREEILATAGIALDAEGRAALEEDLRSPCTTEIAVFQAFARTLEEARTAFVVIDTAPTGHTLLLLDATGAYDRESARHRDPVTPTQTPMQQLKDSHQTKVLVVTLAETTPVLEAALLQADLRRAGIEPWAWIINSVVHASDATSPLLRARAHRERPEIARVLQEHAGRVALVGLAREEPIGLARLQALVGDNLAGPA